jgi:hypothetical protein
MNNAQKRQALAVALLFMFAWHSGSFAQSGPAAKTEVVMLGTGTPLPDPDRSGASTAICDSPLGTQGFAWEIGAFVSRDGCKS